MKPIQQTIFGDYTGNCFQACIASILELNLLDVPHFCVNANPLWWEELQTWCTKRNLLAVDLDYTVENCEFLNLIPDYYIVNGVTKRSSTIYHSVIAYKNKYIFDPFPNGEFLLGIPNSFTLIGNKNNYKFKPDKKDSNCGRVLYFP